MIRNRKERRSLRKNHQATINKYPVNLTPVTEDEYYAKSGKRFANNLISCFVSRSFFVQVYSEGIYRRISVNRNKLNNNAQWEQNITWEELQSIKNEIGYSEKDCVEVYPASIDEVNVSNMRHLWIMDSPLPFAWRHKKEESKNV
jgi:hypothetical protein